MTPLDLDQIETELAIRLPESYRSAMLDYPVVALRGNRTEALWDDCQALIELNRQVRRGGQGRGQWPRHWFALGHQAMDPTLHALDTSTADAHVHWLDHGNPASAGRTGTSFAEWLPKAVNEMRHSIEEEGLSADNSSEALAHSMADTGRGERRVLLGLIVLGVAAVLLWRFWRG